MSQREAMIKGMTVIDRIACRLRREGELFRLSFSGDFGVDPLRTTGFLVSSLAMYCFESVGIAMFLPLLEFVQKGRDINALASSSPIWTGIRKCFQFVGFEVSLLSLMAVIVVLMGFRVVCEYTKQLCGYAISLESHHRIRLGLVREYLLSDYAFFTGRSIGRALNIVTTEAYYAALSIAGHLNLISVVIAILIYLVILFAISMKMTILAILLSGSAVVLTAYVTKSTRSLSRETTQAGNETAFRISEHLALFRLHKLMSNEEIALNHVKEASLNYTNKGLQLKKMSAVVDAVYEPIVIVSILLIFFIGVEIFHTEFVLAGLFLVMLFRLLPHFKSLLAARQNILATSGSLALVSDELLRAHACRETCCGVQPFLGVERSIEFKGVTYTYPEQAQPAILDINLKIPAGEMTAIVGPSGAGKSTLVDLIPRLRAPDKGQIMLDGVSAERFKLKDVRRAVAFLSQDPYIFNDTLLENIRIGNPKGSESAVWEALERVRLAEHVRGLPLRLETVMGERGVKFSGGQKQRLALARVFLQNASVLVLDEPTSALDAEIEYAIQESLGLLRKEGVVTVIVIAHRFSTIRKADNIVVMQEGKIIQQGRHDDLVSSDSWYAMVNEMQLR